MKTFSFFLILKLVARAFFVQGQSTQSQKQEQHYLIKTQQVVQEMKTSLIEESNIFGRKYTYEIPHDRDTTLIIANTTSITIPMQSFSYMDGKLAEGEIKVSVRLFENVWDMYRFGLMTHHDYHIPGLESMAMLHVEASVNNKPVKLAKDIIWHYRPVDKYDDIEHYDLFYSRDGKRWSDADTISRLSGKYFLSLRSRNKSKGFVFETFIPTYLMQYDRLRLAFSYDFVKEPNVILNRRLELVHNLSTGNDIATVIPNEQEALSFLSQIITDSIFDQTGKVNFYLPLGIDTGKIQFEEYYLGISPNSTIEMMAYINQLGYINIDKFLNSESSLIDFVVDSEIITNDTEVKLIFSNRKAILSGDQKLGKVTFKSIPQGEKVWLIIKHDRGNKIGYLVEEVSIQASLKLEKGLSYVDAEVAMDEIGKIIGAIGQ